MRGGELIWEWRGFVLGFCRLGSGAFAEVKKAREIATGRHVAIKVSSSGGPVERT